MVLVRRRADPRGLGDGNAEVLIRLCEQDHSLRDTTPCARANLNKVYEIRDNNAQAFETARCTPLGRGTCVADGLRIDVVTVLSRQRGQARRLN